MMEMGWNIRQNRSLVTRMEKYPSHFLYVSFPSIQSSCAHTSQVNFSFSFFYKLLKVKRIARDTTEISSGVCNCFPQGRCLTIGCKPRCCASPEKVAERGGGGGGGGILGHTFFSSASNNLVSFPDTG